MDCAYQGFATGSVEADRAPLVKLANNNAEFFIAQSFSKNFGLYNERVGNLVVVLRNAAKVDAVRSQLKKIARAMWSNPPAYGARIVATTLTDETLAQQWRQEVAMMSQRIKDMRQLLYEKLKVHEISWDHIVNQIGMFSFTGLTQPQVKYLRDNHRVFLMDDGRINMCAITSHNAQYIADAFSQAIKQVPS
jgi:aspartate aminotransferase